VPQEKRKREENAPRLMKRKGEKRSPSVFAAYLSISSEKKKGKKAGVSAIKKKGEREKKGLLCEVPVARGKKKQASLKKEREKEGTSGDCFRPAGRKEKPRWPKGIHSAQAI